jgi:hypothetical protein
LKICRQKHLKKLDLMKSKLHMKSYWEGTKGPFHGFRFRSEERKISKGGRGALGRARCQLSQVEPTQWRHFHPQHLFTSPLPTGHFTVAMSRFPFATFTLKSIGMILPFRFSTNAWGSKEYIVCITSSMNNSSYVFHNWKETIIKCALYQN